MDLQQLPQLEALCERLYTAQVGFGASGSRKGLRLSRDMLRNRFPCVGSLRFPRVKRSGCKWSKCWAFSGNPRNTSQR